MKNDTAISWVWGIGFVLVPATADADGALFVLLALGAIALGVGLFWIIGGKPKAGRK